MCLIYSSEMYEDSFVFILTALACVMSIILNNKCMPLGLMEFILSTMEVMLLAGPHCC